VPADLEARGTGKRLAEDQAGSVVESFESLGVELLESALLAPRLGLGAFGQASPRGSMAEYAVQPAARDKRCVGGCTHLLSFLALLII
jgi:hypothetical protein